MKWILKCDRRGDPPRRAHVRDMANMILRTADPSVFTLVGENWVPSFIKCRDEIHCRFARKYAYEIAKMRGIKAYTGLVYNCERCGVMGPLPIQGP